MKTQTIKESVLMRSLKVAIVLSLISIAGFNLLKSEISSLISQSEVSTPGQAIIMENNKDYSYQIPANPISTITEVKAEIVDHISENKIGSNQVNHVKSESIPEKIARPAEALNYMIPPESRTISGGTIQKSVMDMTGKVFFLTRDPFESAESLSEYLAEANVKKLEEKSFSELNFNVVDNVLLPAEISDSYLTGDKTIQKLYTIVSLKLLLIDEPENQLQIEDWMISDQLWRQDGKR